MADDSVTADPGSGGAVFKTDLDTGVSAHVPVTKIELGANDTFDGFVASGNPMPVQITDGTNTISAAVEDVATPATISGLPIMMERDDAIGALTPIEGDWASLRCSAEGALWVQEFNSDAILADTANMDTNLGTIAGAVAGSEMQVDIVSGTVTANAGTNLNTSALATEATLASVIGTDGAAGPASAISIAGTNAGNLQEIAVDASGNIEVNVANTPTVTVSGTVTVDSELSTAAALADNTANPTTSLIGSCLMAYDGATWDRVTVGGGTEATALRVTVASDSTGSLGVTNAGLTDLASAINSARMDCNISRITGLIPDMGSGARSANTFRVTVATDDLVPVDLGANNDVTINGSSVVYTEDAGTVTDGIMAQAVRDDEVGATQVVSADGDAVNLRANKFGMLKVTQMPDATSEVKYAVIDDATSGDNTIVAAAGAGIKIRVLAAFLVAAGDVDARFESGAAGTALTGQMDLTANSGFTLPFCPVGWFETADNTLLNLELSAAVSVDGCLVYVEV